MRSNAGPPLRGRIPLAAAVPAAWILDAAFLLPMCAWLADALQALAGVDVPRLVIVNLIAIRLESTFFHVASFAAVFPGYFLIFVLAGAPSPGLAALGHGRIRFPGAPAPWMRLHAFLFFVPMAFIAPFLAPLSRSRRSFLDQWLVFEDNGEMILHRQARQQCVLAHWFHISPVTGGWVVHSHQEDGIGDIPCFTLEHHEATTACEVQ